MEREKSGKQENFTDDDLIRLIQEGESQAMDWLMERYKLQVRNQARALYLIGGDNDDLIQEGMLGLFKAIRDYQPGKEHSFESFARLCVTRQMYSAIKASNRQKHAPLNSYVELSPQLGESAGGPLEKSPEELFIDQENMEQRKQEIRRLLSPFEQRVLKLYLGGADYHEIARRLSKSSKSIDNALQRIRRKLQHF